MPSPPSEVLAQEVRRWRTERRLSAQDLANRLAELGSTTLNRRVISKIENGERGVSVDEWLQLAHALAVPPAVLLVNLESGEGIAVAPNLHLHPWVVWSWIAGQFAGSPVPPSPSASDDGRSLARLTHVDEFARASRAVQLYEAEQDAARALAEADVRVRSAEYTGDETRLAVEKEAKVAALKDLARTFDAMIENGMNPPPTSEETIGTMRLLGLLTYPDRWAAWLWQPGQEPEEITTARPDSGDVAPPA